MPTATTCRVLLVDDDALVRTAIRRFLLRRGGPLNVTEAHDARTALDRLEQESFDAVVTDVEMPGRSGLWLLRQVRDRWADLPVILMTGRPPAVAAAGTAAADAILIKPFDLRELDARIRTLVTG